MSDTLAKIRAEIEKQLITDNLEEWGEYGGGYNMAMSKALAIIDRELAAEDAMDEMEKKQ